jgi:hypothetical protein
MEHQAQPEEHFNWRMFRYFAPIHFKYGVPVYPIALFSDPSSRREEPDTYRVVFPDLEVLTFRYRVIQLRRLRWKDYATRLNPVACALLSRMGMQRSERPKVLLASLRLLAQLPLDPARQRLVSGFIDTYLRLTEEEQGQFQTELAQLSPTEQEATMELTTSWKEEGIQEGLREGIQQGKQEGLREGQHAEAITLTLRLLTRRFGVLAPDLETQIEHLPLPHLEALAEDLLDFSSIADVQHWLATHPPDAAV